MKSVLSIIFALSVSSLAQAQTTNISAAEIEAGKKIFTQKSVPACTVCHTLKHAGSTGEIGPVLDELKPNAERIEKALRSGLGAMPSFKASLTEQEIKTVSRYVAAVAGK
jgi:sulfite dehydrogenase